MKLKDKIINSPYPLLIIVFFLISTGSTVYYIVKQNQHNSLIQQSEEFLLNNDPDNAVIYIKEVLSEDQHNKRANEILYQIQKLYEDSADLFIEEHKYSDGIEYYNKALSIEYNENIKSKLDRTVNELENPKIFIGNTPLISEIYINEEPAGLSFKHLPLYSEIKAGIQVHEYSQGNILKIKIITPSELSHFIFKISNNDSSYSGSAFKVEDCLWYAFIGLSCIIKTGTYNLTGEGLYLSGSKIKLTGKIEVTKRDFPHETIYFDEDLTALLTEPTPEQTAERRYLRSLINQVNPDSIYEKDNFILPLNNYPRSTTFGDRCMYILSDGSDYTSVHRGIDFAAPPGTPVESMGKGKVVMAVYRILTGYTVVIEHLPGIYSIYYHLSELLASEGDMVNSGDIIGKVGSTGLSTGPHLHLGFYCSGEYVDPEYFVLNQPFQ